MGKTRDLFKKIQKFPFKKILLYNSSPQFSFANSETREALRGLFHNQYTNPPLNLYNVSLCMFVLQGDYE